jgi:hypothetical protein
MLRVAEERGTGSGASSHSSRVGSSSSSTSLHNDLTRATSPTRHRQNNCWRTTKAGETCRPLPTTRSLGQCLPPRSSNPLLRSTASPQPRQAATTAVRIPWPRAATVSPQLKPP